MAQKKKKQPFLNDTNSAIAFSKKRFEKAKGKAGCDIEIIALEQYKVKRRLSDDELKQAQELALFSDSDTDNDPRKTFYLLNITAQDDNGTILPVAVVKVADFEIAKAVTNEWMRQIHEYDPGQEDGVFSASAQSQGLKQPDTQVVSSIYYCKRFKRLHFEARDELGITFTLRGVTQNEDYMVFSKERDKPCVFAFRDKEFIMEQEQNLGVEVSNWIMPDMA